MLCNVTPGNWGGADSTSSKPALVMEGATQLFLVHPHLASLCDEEAPVRIINWCTACTKRENMPLLCKIDKLKAIKHHLVEQFKQYSMSDPSSAPDPNR